MERIRSPFEAVWVVVLPNLKGKLIILIQQAYHKLVLHSDFLSFLPPFRFSETLFLRLALANVSLKHRKLGFFSRLQIYGTPAKHTASNFDKQV